MAEEPEFSEDRKAESFDVQRYLNLARRRHMFFLIPLLVGWLVVWGASWVLQARYKSSTLILVEQPSMPKTLVEPNISDNLQDRLQSITQQILSRTRLVSIIDKLHLYESGSRQMTLDQKVDVMRKDIEIELVHDARNEQITAFKINYSAANPRLAQQVTGELTDLFINENIKVRQQQSEDTTEFIASQLENARANLAEQENRVRGFKARFQGELPSQQATNLQILGGLQAQLQNEHDALNNAKQQGVYLQSLVEQYHAFRVSQGTEAGSPADLPAIDKELGNLRSKLADLSAHYTDRYPDILRLKGQIAKTEKMRDDLLADLKAKATEGKQADGKAVEAEVMETPALLQLESQLRANRVEVTTREQAISALTSRINEYQARLNNGPARELEMTDLSRGYDQSKANYDDLLKKKNQSEMATSMEQMQQGERFRMLDPPSLPAKPDFPNRLKLCGIGIGVGLALGLCVAGGFEILDGRIHNEEEIKALLPVPIISNIPEILVPSEEQNSRRRVWLGWTTAAVVTATILAGSAFSYFHE